MIKKLLDVFPNLRNITLCVKKYRDIEKMSIVNGLDCINIKNLKWLSLKFGERYSFNDYGDKTFVIQNFENLETVLVQNVFFGDGDEYDYNFLKVSFIDLIKIKQILIFGCTLVSSLKKHSETLENLWIHTSILSEDNVGDFKKLICLSITGITNVRSIANLPKLEIISYKGNAIFQTSLLKDLPSLRIVDIKNTNSDFRWEEPSIKLVNLNLFDANLEGIFYDVSLLNTKVDNLKVECLNIFDVDFSSFQELKNFKFEGNVRKIRIKKSITESSELMKKANDMNEISLTHYTMWESDDDVVNDNFDLFKFDEERYPMLNALYLSLKNIKDVNTKIVGYLELYELEISGVLGVNLEIDDLSCYEVRELKWKIDSTEKNEEFSDEESTELNEKLEKFINIESLSLIIGKKFGISLELIDIFSVKNVDIDGCYSVDCYHFKKVLLKSLFSLQKVTIKHSCRVKTILLEDLMNLAVLSINGYDGVISELKLFDCTKLTELNILCAVERVTIRNIENIEEICLNNFKINIFPSLLTYKIQKLKLIECEINDFYDINGNQFPNLKELEINLNNSRFKELKNEKKFFIHDLIKLKKLIVSKKLVKGMKYLPNLKLLKVDGKELGKEKK